VSLTPDQIEAMVEKKVAEILASRAAATSAPPPAATSQQPAHKTTNCTQTAISEEVQRRLEALERRIEREVQARGNDSRSDGLRLLLPARQAKERGDEEAALRFYESALPFFPGQPKLLGKIERLRAKLGITAPGGNGAAEVAREDGSVKESKARAHRSA